ncbi:response regulator transcription factor [Calidithermus roseus]|uniref:Putative transcriptional regulatory protein NarL n=1 Tax=Calidithermus roseus TaxID=1644118 RepID=A0A399ES96_9DEIN|nr:response regulator transcription factor [Calidithermus roseus]RIH86396.1 putative transcriptional regulatory protein NarL [Calidithermus roseus]
MRLIIADDHPLFRMGLRAALELQGYEVVAETGDGLTAVQRVQELEPDAVLLDIRMPELDGLSTARRLREGGYGGLIVMLTTFGEPALLYQAAQAGVDAYWSKEMPPEELGQRLSRLAQGLEPKLQIPDLPTLSPREKEVLTQLAKGQSTKEIARGLKLSPETVKDHLERLYAKLDARNRVEALERARGLGLL